MALKKRLEYIIDQVNDKFNIDLTSEKRERELVVGRVAFANAMRKYYTTVQIGRVMNKNHATVCHYASMGNVYDELALYKDIFKFARNAYMISEYQEGIVSEDILNSLRNLRQDLESLEGMVRNYMDEHTDITYDHSSKGV